MQANSYRGFEDLNSFVSNFTSEDHHVLPAISVTPASLFKTPARGWWSLPEQLCALEFFVDVTNRCDSEMESVKHAMASWGRTESKLNISGAVFARKSMTRSGWFLCS